MLVLLAAALSTWSSLDPLDSSETQHAQPRTSQQVSMAKILLKADLPRDAIGPQCGVLYRTSFGNGFASFTFDEAGQMLVAEVPSGFLMILRPIFRTNRHDWLFTIDRDISIEWLYLRERQKHLIGIVRARKIELLLHKWLTDGNLQLTIPNIKPGLSAVLSFGFVTQDGDSVERSAVGFTVPLSLEDGILKGKELRHLVHDYHRNDLAQQIQDNPSAASYLSSFCRSREVSHPPTGRNTTTHIYDLILRLEISDEHGMIVACYRTKPIKLEYKYAKELIQEARDMIKRSPQEQAEKPDG